MLVQSVGDRLPSRTALDISTWLLPTSNTKQEQPVPLAEATPLRLLFLGNRWQAALTSTRVHLQLPVNVGLVYQGVKDIEDTVNVPDFGIGAKEVNLLL